MGQLLTISMMEGRSFVNRGVDYRGSFFLKEGRHRIRIRIKVYVTFFICLATKVVHLGAVSDLPTDAFIAKLERFVVRYVGNIRSNNGTNFDGTNAELLALCRKDN